MRLLCFDLDDTLMWCGQDYTDAKQEFGEFIAEKVDISPENAIEKLEDIDSENVEEYGLSKERFPSSFAEACRALVSDVSEAEIETARKMGQSVFKTTDEYAQRGFMKGAEELLQSLSGKGFDLHLITAGDTDIQQRKIDGLQLDRYFDETHIVPINSKKDRLVSLMDEHGYTTGQTYHIGNSLTSDVQAALEADIRAVYLPTHEWRSVDDASYYLDHERVSIYPDIEELLTEAPDVFLEEAPA